MQDILTAIDRIAEYTVKGKDEFLENYLVQDGVIRQFSIIGEAAAKLPKIMKDRYLDIPWKKIVGMRNIIIHDYSEINIQRVWETIVDDLPILKTAVMSMFSGEKASQS